MPLATGTPSRGAEGGRCVTARAPTVCHMTPVTRADPVRAGRAVTHGDDVPTYPKTAVGGPTTR